MCGRYAVTTDPALLATELEAINEVDSSAPDAPTTSYNVAPTDTVAVVVDRHDRAAPADPASRRVRAMRWGLVPPWTKELGSGPLLINARDDTVAEKPAFRSSLKSRRALVPMDGWYEWTSEPDPTTGKARKVPYYMTPSDGSRFYMAGLWTAWKPAGAPADAAPLLSCTIITTAAVGALRQVHDRMPLVVTPTHWDAWLDPDAPALPELLTPLPTELIRDIEIRRVVPLVNNVANQGPQLLTAATDDPPATLF